MYICGGRLLVELVLGLSFYTSYNNAPYSTVQRSNELYIQQLYIIILITNAR